MAWPFSGVAAPNKDSAFMAVPTSLANPTNFDSVTVYWLLGGHWANDTDADLAIAVLDGSNVVIVPHMVVPARKTLALNWEFIPVTGVQWVATGAGITGKVWGYA